MKSISRGRLLIFALTVVFALLFLYQSRRSQEVVLSFVYTGCNRLDRHDVDKFPSSANVPQLTQTFSDISKIEPAPGLFVFAGDLVVNLRGDQGKTLRSQLNHWFSLYENSPLARTNEKIPFIPIMGNHESDVYSDVLQGEYPDAANAEVWLDWIKQHHFDRYAGNGPAEPYLQPDALAQNNNQNLTYSFQVNGVHFILVNTDTFTTTPSADNPDFPANGWVAYHWIKDDIERAQDDPSVSHIVVLGHKPLKGPLFYPGKTNIINTEKYPLADRLIELFGGLSKFSGYFAAHSHDWEYRNLESDSGSIPQVIAGNGGSPLVTAWKPEGGVYFGFTQVKLYRNGSVGVVSYRRPVPDPYDSEEGVIPAVPAAEIIIKP